MPRGLPQRVRDNLEKAQAAATAAVEAYNRPGPRFRTAQYLVMITIAWTALLHALFYKRGRRPWYRKRETGTGRGVRYVKVDGECKHWDLAECLRQHWQDQNPPERKNLEFLVGLRNKIEHRHLPELDASLYGECQAALMNFEDLLVGTFGPRYALTDQLAISLQFSRVTPLERRAAARVLASTSAKTVKEYIETFRGGLPSTVLNSTKYSFNVYLIPKVVNRASAAEIAVEFVSFDAQNPEEMERLEKLTTLVREKHIPILNLDLYKPGQVVEELRGRIPFRINMGTHTAAWKHYRLHPASGDGNPQRTVQEYCVYDQVHKDYLFTRAWIERLVRELSDLDTFRRVVGREPISA